MNDALSKEERDAISEMSSIGLGAAASTLGILVGQELEVTPPRLVEYVNLAEMDIPFGKDTAKTLVLLQYVKGIYSTALIIIKNTDARRLAEMMLSSSESTDSEELTELESGALGELMSQMMNASTTGLASLMHEAVEINNPEIFPYSSDILAQCLPQVLIDPFIAIQSQFKAGADVLLEMIELRPSAEMREHVAKLMSLDAAEPNPELEAVIQQETLEAEAPAQQPTMAATAGAASASYRQPQAQYAPAMQVDPVTVRPVEFGSFDHQPNVFGEENKNLSLVMDVTLNLSVELGKTELPIKDVLELTRGSVIELDRVAGEPVDLLANGKLIAKGEVVVIEDNFGLRITSIISPAERLRGL